MHAAGITSRRTVKAVAQGVLMLVAASVAASALAAAPALAAGAPDLALSRAGPGTVAIGAAFTEHLTVVNDGTEATPGIELSYAPGGPVVTGKTPGVSCQPVLKGHSGRGGGYTRVGWDCVDAIAGGLAPGARIDIALSVTPKAVGPLTESVGVSPSPAATQLDLVSHSVAATISVITPPAPAAPTAVAAEQSRDTLNVSWTPDPATARYVTSSTIVATPTVGSSWPTLSQTVADGAHEGAVPGLEPATTYSVTVAGADAGGPGAASAPILFTTPPSTLVPTTPKITYASWISSGAPSAIIAIRWSVFPGDSPIDGYDVRAHAYDSDTPGSYSAVLDGSSASAYLPVDVTLDWSVQVRAHDAAGWSAWSGRVIVPALN